VSRWVATGRRTECSRGRVRKGKEGEGDVVKGQARAKGQRTMTIG
jgi:hypothetical protein